MKRKYFIRFFVVISATVLLLLLIYELLIRFANVPEASYAIEIFITQYVVTLLIFFLLLKALSFEPHYFIQVALISIVAKLVIYGSVIFIIIYMSPKTANANVVVFCSIYLVLTVLELAMLYPVMSLEKNKSANQQ